MKRTKGRPVEKIDRAGNVVATYSCAKEAAKQNFMSGQTLLNRCHGIVRKPYDADGYTYRFKEEANGST